MTIYYCKNCNLYYNFKYFKDIKINNRLCLICLLETMERIYCNNEVFLDSDKGNIIKKPLICDYGFIDLIYYV